MKENIKAPRHWPLCGEFTGEFPAQMASNAENVSIWWRHHAIWFCLIHALAYDVKMAFWIAYVILKLLNEQQAVAPNWYASQYSDTIALFLTSETHQDNLAYYDVMESPEAELYVITQNLWIHIWR